MPRRDIGGFRVGIVGAGGVADGYHAPVLRSLGVRLEWVCDLDGERAQRFAAEHGIGVATSRLETAPEVDAVLIAIPVGARRMVLNDVFERRWNALVEKPFAVTVDEHRQILRDAQQAGVAVGVGLMRRFHRTILGARELLRSGVFGPLRRVWAAEGMPLRGTGRGDDWYQGDPSASGGGVVAETGSHLIDQVLFLTDTESVGDPSAEFTSEAGLTLEARLRATASRRGQEEPFGIHVALSQMRDLYNAIVLCFDHARLRVGTAANGSIELLDDQFLPVGNLTLRTDGAEGVYQAFAMEWQAFIGQCLEGGTGDADAATAVLSTQLIEAVAGAACIGDDSP